MATGWLDGARHGLTLDLTGADLTYHGGRVETLSALAGAPPPGLLWTRPPLVIRYDDLLVEYRVPAADGWDRGLPRPGTDAIGWVVVHRSAPGGPMVADYVTSVGAAPGATLVLVQHRVSPSGVR
jgi:hypothetical protein